MKKPIILCGLGRVGSRVLEYLEAAGQHVVVIDDRCEPSDPRLRGARLVCGDCRKREILEQAGVADCAGVLIVTSDDLVNISATLMVRSLNAAVTIVLRVFNENLIGRLGKAITNIFPLSTSALTAPLLAVKALTGQALGAFQVAGLENGRRQVTELTIAANSPLRGRRLKELVTRFNLLIVVRVPAEGEERFLTDIDLQARLQAGDHLCLCGDPEYLGDLLALSEGKDTADLLWASWLRRNGRMAWRTLTEIDLPVKLCTLALLIVLTTGTVVFLKTEREGVGSALYHTVSVMATMADMRALPFGDELKIFVSGLRLAGAALVAAFTAIFANYLLRASLGGALEVRRIPDGGHVLVAGLGAIGYRLVEELVQAEQRVVVIEADRDNRFVPTVRRKGVPVIIGDASIHEVIRQAHGGTARAVVACTSNDLVNIEVALVARELNPKQRVVVLQSDPNLAQLLREAANVRLAVSVPVLAAPAFIAGLFGDRVQSVFLSRERMFAVIDVVVQAQDTHLVGQSGKTVAIDHRVLPVAIIPADGSPPPRNPMHARLAPGDRLVAIILLTDLESLLRRQRPAGDWAVDVTGFPQSKREWLTLFYQRSLEVTQEAASTTLSRVPFCLGRNLTRGQALDLLELLEREHISAKMRPCVDGENGERGVSTPR